MGYIGNEPTTGHFPVQTNLVGPGPTYTLDRAPATAGAIEVSVQGVLQPTTAYSVSGTTLTMAGVTTGIPIFIRYLGETLTLPTIADGVVVEGKIGAGAVTNTKIGAGAVTDAKLASSGTMPAWNGAALTGITHTPANDSVDGAQLSPALVAGDIIYSDGTDSIERLAKGTAEQVLTMNTGATAPEWATSIIPYDIAFTAGFDKDMIAEDVVANAVYGELVMGRAGTFTGEAGYVDTAPVGSVLQVDVFKNGVTIYATTKPQFAAGATALTAGVITVTTFAVNDRITFKVILKGSTAGKGLRFTLKCKV